MARPVALCFLRSCSGGFALVRSAKALRELGRLYRARIVLLFSSHSSGKLRLVRRAGSDGSMGRLWSDLYRYGGRPYAIRATRGGLVELAPDSPPRSFHGTGNWMPVVTCCSDSTRARVHAVSRSHASRCRGCNLGRVVCAGCISALRRVFLPPG